MSPDTGHALCHSPQVHRHPRYQQWLHPSEKETHAQSSNSHLVHVEAGPKPRQPSLEELLTQGGEGLGFHTQSTASAQHLVSQSFISRLHSGWLVPCGACAQNPSLALHCEIPCRNFF